MSITPKSIVSKYFEDFSIGDKYVLPSRTQTSAIFSMFQGASGDNDPIHYDKEFCKQRGHPEMLAHGLQVLIQTAAGAGTFPSEVRDTLLGLIEVSGKILKPVYREDTLYPELVISNLISQNTTGIIEMKALVNNQNNVLLDDNYENKNDKYSFAEEIIEEETLSIQDKELELIIKALERNNGRRKAAANELGISERTLYRKIKQYDLEL